MRLYNLHADEDLVAEVLNDNYVVSLLSDGSFNDFTQKRRSNQYMSGRKCKRSVIKSMMLYYKYDSYN